MRCAMLVECCLLVVQYILLLSLPVVGRVGWVCYVGCR